MDIGFRSIFVLALIVCAGISAGTAFWRIFRLMKIARPEAVVWDIPTRLWIMTRDAIFQRKMFKEFWPGVFHAFIFVGFIVVTIGSAEHILSGLNHRISFDFLPFYPQLVLAQDILSVLVLTAVAYFLWRRVVVRNPRLSKDPAHRRDGLIVLAFTGGHILADVLAFTFWAAAGDPHGLADLRPVTSSLAGLVRGQGAAADSLNLIAWFFWGLSVASVFFFLAYIPYSKHIHIMLAGPNLFFSRLRPKGRINKINFEDESNTSFGVGMWPQFTWKDILDAFTCTACGRCNVYCPTATTGKPLKPMKLIQDLKSHVLRTGDGLLAQVDGAQQTKDLAMTPEPLNPSEPLISMESGITEQTVWACTTCRACVEACPVGIEHIDKIVEMRRHMVLMEGKMSAELQGTMRNWETNSNPWGMAPDTRDEWARGLGVKSFAEHPTAEWLFYVGCAGSFNDRNKKISTSFVRILQSAGVDFAILGKEELCNGETARRAGNEYLAKAMIDANVEVLKRHNVKKIVATCPHCFNTLKNEYPDFGFKAEKVLHHTEMIDQLIKEGHVKPAAGTNDEQLRVVFHDSCYLGRYNDVYDAPREALSAMPGVEVIEMPRHKQTGLCCGAGGARMWMEETIGKRINVERVEEALEQRPQVIAAACPYCQVMINDGVNAKGQGESVKILDVAEVVASRL